MANPNDWRETRTPEEAAAETQEPEAASRVRAEDEKTSRLQLRLLEPEQ